MGSSILVTGGAGYIGSHVARQLSLAGHTVVVLDNLSKGFPEAVIDCELVVGDTGDQVLAEKLIHKHSIDTVMHFAAYTVVPESLTNPLNYYRNNTLNSHALLTACANQRVSKFVFSSTAAVYGIPVSPSASEDSPVSPINPYGASKLMTEWMLRDMAAATSLRHVTLRYFNVAGSDPTGQIGQSTPDATLLIKVACQAVCGKRESVAIFGTDFPTPDGTGVRDYIHVEDLAFAHLKALEYLEEGGESSTLNCGYGHGYSVREVLSAVERVSGEKLNIRESGRRPGDPATLIANANRIKYVLGWSAKWDDLDTIVRSSLNWERNPRY